ncbi:MAG: formylglycine-generating enzyme family protein, partial [Candidatus Poribacteria bacterium]
QTSDKSKEMPKEIIGKDGAKMVLIPAGEFQMGTDASEIPELAKLTKDKESSWFADETPRHTVFVDAFYMDVYEVTNAQYKKFVQATGHKEPEGFGIDRVEGNTIYFKSGFKPWADKSYNGDNQPVVCVTWEDAKAYAEWAGKRLPTEAEWEYAARGGLVGKGYVWGDWPPLEGSGNFADETFKKAFPSKEEFPNYWIFINGYDDGYACTAPVGSYKPNGYGLYDMAGNVWEWCADWYNSIYYATSPKSNPRGPDSGSFHVLRVGSWHDDITLNLHVANRNIYLNPMYLNSNIGFRCVVSVTP